MLSKIFLIATLILSGAISWAGTDELDQDRQNQSIQGTVVLRVHQQTGEMAMLQVDETVSTKEGAAALASADFKAIPQENLRSELDREAGASSWYWYYNPGFYGFNYYYYGNCYSPWYNYSWGSYSYYYYNRFSYYW